ncbi:sterol desaturase family protein [Pedobacter sp. UYP30]|uniref:sterol desaturase family protein n=1 Tax=Pedobacter sp. UYP30 TaxID=1756400 RepID=UPI003396A464
MTINLFGAAPIELDNLKNITANAPEIIVWAAPVMFLCVLIEWFISHRQHRDIYNKEETIASILVGIGNVFVAFLLKFGLFFLIVAIYNLLPWRMSLTWWTIIPCYILLDFCSYWSHRISHHQRFWWATHIVHHSGENYNLTVSFRLSWVQHIKIIFFLPVALAGFHPVVFFVANQIAVLFQFWVHTEYIKKLPRPFEYLFATPSNHRVHHGSQEKYINKNFGATFIIWDRIFGTYEPEHEKVIYGLTHKLEKKGNPFYINFHEFIDIWRDVRLAKGFRKKMFFLFGDPSDIEKERLNTLNKLEQGNRANNKCAPPINYHALNENDKGYKIAHHEMQSR